MQYRPKVRVFNNESQIMNTATFSFFARALGAAALSVCAMQAATAATSVAISINQPGVYGRVTLGEPLPRSAYVNAAPVIITQPAYAYQREPIYLYVPTSHSSNWGRYCGRYGACSQPVVFVQDRWVRDRYTQHQSQYRQNQYRGRDSDRDGIPNRFDRDRDNDGVRNRNDCDRDGDGVRNSRDRQPNNPNQR